MRKLYVGLSVVALLLVGAIVGRECFNKPSHYVAAAAAATTTSTTPAPTTTTTTTVAPTTTTASQIVLTSDADLEEAMNSAAINLIGQSTEPGGDQPFIDYYHALERQARGNAAAGKTYYTMTPEPMAESYLETNYPNDVQLNSVGKNLVTVQKMISGGGPYSSYNETTTTVKPTTTTTERKCSSPTTMFQSQYPCSNF